MIDTIIRDLIVNNTGKTHLIIDISELGKFPTRLADIKQSSERYLKHPNMGVIVVVGKANPVTTFLARVISQVAGVQLIHTASTEEVLSYLRKYMSKTS